MRRWIRNLMQMSAGDRLLLVMTLILIGGMRLGLLLLPFRTLLKVVAKISQPHKEISVAREVSVNKIIWAVNAMSRYMPGVKCLARALTCQVLMNRHGYSHELRIGIAKGETGKLEAHAWIEYQGHIIIGNLPNLSHFMPLPSLEGIRL
jgi:Transglutaminase-like superfamily